MKQPTNNQTNRRHKTRQQNRNINQHPTYYNYDNNEMLMNIWTLPFGDRLNLEVAKPLNIFFFSSKSSSIKSITGLQTEKKPIQVSSGNMCEPFQWEKLPNIIKPT